MKRNLLTLLIILLSVIYGGNNLSAQNYVAKVGSTEYPTINEAIANWTNGTTLTLLADVTLSDVITLNSTEHHILDLSTYTMTAASGKNAIVIKACGNGSAEQTAITIKADATNPGGINAGSKDVIYYKYADGGISGTDRPIINIKGGVFTGNRIYFEGAKSTVDNAARKAATLKVEGGIFNCSINGVSKSKLLILGGIFNKSVSSWGDSTALRLISGGKFKSSISGTMDSNNTKFWIGTSMANSNVGVYVNEDLYLVICDKVITDYSEDYPCSTTYSSSSTWSTPLTYSSANPNTLSEGKPNPNQNGLYYTSIKVALDNNNSSSKTVNIHTGTLDLTAETNAYTYIGFINLPETESTFTVKFHESKKPNLSLRTSVEDGGVIYTETKDEETNIVTRIYSIHYPCYDRAGINDIHYATLSDAYTAANDNDVIYIIKDFEEESLELDKNITIDLCGYTINTGFIISTGKTVTMKNGTINVKGENVIVNNGTISMDNLVLNGGGSNIVFKGSGIANITSTCKVTNGYLEYYGNELYNYSSNIYSIVKKDFIGLGADSQGSTLWSTISVPIANATIPSATAGIHDLYRFNEAKELWEYYKDDGNSENGVASNPFTKMELCRGYLYANTEGITLEFKGKITSSSSSYQSYTLSYTASNSLAGFNLIGNPYTYTINFSQLKNATLVQGYYIINEDGAWEPKTTDTPIAPLEAILIKTTGTNKKLRIYPNTGSKRAARNENSYLTINVASKTHSDVAYVSFNDGMGLDKINHRNPDNPMLYIPVEGKNYAIAMMNQDVKEVPVYFNANRMAEYTISIEQKNCEFNTMTLVDKLTGIETNMLIEDYTFMARTFDDANRFVIRMSIEDNDDSETENFAYVSNGSIVIEKIEGNANIRIFDIMGRHLIGTNATGNANIPVETMSTGMYIIQMSDDNGVKVQKIIID